MNELLDELKIVFDLRHVLTLANAALFIIVSFINWDLLWWWNIGDWNSIDRVMFLLIVCFINFLAIMGYKDWMKKDNNNE